ncbi:hypothetical protein Tco_0994706 [Tanacetum coccineum]
MAVNTKFLNSLQPEWFKYVTNVRLSKNLAEDSYDTLFDHLQQYEGIVNAFRAKRVAKTHDPLDLVPNTYESHYARDCLKPRVQDSKYFLEQMLLAKKDKAGIILINENNDFLLANASEIEEFEYLSATVNNPCTSFMNPLYAQSGHEQTYHGQPEIIKPTIRNDRINRNIIFDDPNVEVDDGNVKHDKNAHGQKDAEMELLARNAYEEAEKQQINEMLN